MPLHGPPVTGASSTTISTPSRKAVASNTCLIYADNCAVVIPKLAAWHTGAYSWLGCSHAAWHEQGQANLRGRFRQDSNGRRVPPVAQGARNKASDPLHLWPWDVVLGSRKVRARTSIVGHCGIQSQAEDWGSRLRLVLVVTLNRACLLYISRLWYTC